MDTQAGRLLDDLQAIRARARALVDRVPDDAASGSPIFALIRPRAGTGLCVMLAHMRRHLQQAESVAGWHTS